MTLDKYSALNKLEYLKSNKHVKIKNDKKRRPF